MDRDVLTSLLKGGHLNVEQRINKGLWPHSSEICRSIGAFSWNN